jgi:hypothetical protein
MNIINTIDEDTQRKSFEENNVKRLPGTLEPQEWISTEEELDLGSSSPH